MSKKRDGGAKKARSIDVPLDPVQPSQPYHGNDASQSHGPEYYEGRDSVRREQYVHEKEKEHNAKLEEERANYRIVVEFGQGSVTFRDGLDRMIRRECLSGDWVVHLAELMSIRNCKRYGVRIGEHAHFSIRERFTKEEKAARAIGKGPGMQIEKEREY